MTPRVYSKKCQSWPAIDLIKSILTSLSSSCSSYARAFELVDILCEPRKEITGINSMYNTIAIISARISFCAFQMVEASKS
ncbi:hypothetical protein RIR_jg19558.t1 [Rhizophagus irregularis DAOM 181602=DAOM 197198]|nr:hypothetical protein RIR_jg19558.t1 [Rhizophagus irregularis DAOM 181602=DAOM 197198]